MHKGNIMLPIDACKHREGDQPGVFRFILLWLGSCNTVVNTVHIRRAVTGKCSTKAAVCFHSFSCCCGLWVVFVNNHSRFYRHISRLYWQMKRQVLLSPFPLPLHSLYLWEAGGQVRPHVGWILTFPWQSLQTALVMKSRAVPDIQLRLGSCF